ncbi:MAG: type III-A CRISPR-associated RAMP protein Csm3 [Candidatus Moranbacteria bacterium]|nr:type III-A CRISPR-associated RAMP protein Csm3 [Candidatus Moranbacteria bacterium]
MAEIERQIKLLGYIKITAEIEALTGLHIGGTADSIDKGGIDNPVIKNPVTNEPYIPGSSLRGRIRSLLEKKTAKVLSPMTNDIWMEIYKVDDKVYSNNKAKSTIDAMNSEVCRVFGNSASYESVPSVLIVRDALYTDKTREKYMQGGKGGLPITEAKMEIAVDRITAHALPRTIERVPAGARFAFEVVYKIQSVSFISAIDEKGKPKKVESYMADANVIKKDIENIIWALKQIEENDGLGGNTSRGHGQVKFSNLTIKHEVFENDFKQKIEHALKDMETTKAA